MKRLFEPGSSQQTLALVEVAITANINILCVTGADSPICDDQPGQAIKNGTRQDGLWDQMEEAHWRKEPGKGPAGPIRMRKTEKDVD